jgi:large subunit ribosomal protein L6
MVKFINKTEELEIPAGIDCKLNGKIMTVKGKLGTVTKDFSHAILVNLRIEGKKVIISADFPRRTTIALVGTMKNVINNMFLGVQQGYTYKMKIVFSHFPITVEIDKKTKQVAIKNFIGERAPRYTSIVGDSVVTADKDEVIIKGIDKDAVGQTSANIQKRCRIREKDLRVFQDGIFIYEKMLGDQQLWVIR